MLVIIAKGLARVGAGTFDYIQHNLSNVARGSSELLLNLLKAENIVI